MKCLSCNKKESKYKYCKKCFVNIVERRVRKHVRVFGLKKDQKIVVNDNVTMYFLENIIHLPLKINKNIGLKLSLITIDDECSAYLERLLLGKKTKKHNSLFSCLTDEELVMYCDYKKIKFVPKKSLMKEKLHKIEKKHQGTLYALHKSMVDGVL